MSSRGASLDEESYELRVISPRPRASDWLWKPWYAKLWWAAIPIYWAPAGGPTRIASVADFYDSGYAIVPNLLFLPATALCILGFRYFGRMLDEGGSVEIWRDRDHGSRRRPGLPHPSMDEFNPRSGPRWIGNHTRNRLLR